MTVYKSDGTKSLTDYMDAVEKNPSIMDTVGADGQCYDPEICFGVKYESDENGREYLVLYVDEASSAAEILIN